MTFDWPIPPEEIIIMTRKEEQTNELRKASSFISHLRLDLEDAGLLEYNDSDPVFAATEVLFNALFDKADKLGIPR